MIWTITRDRIPYMSRLSYHAALWAAEFCAAFNTSIQYAIIHPDGTVEPIERSVRRF